MKEFIEGGILKRSINNTVKMVNYEMKFLNESHLEEILQLQTIVADSLDNQELFVMDSREFILEQVLRPGSGKAIGIYVNKGLVAYRTVSFPGNSDWNLGRELGIAEEELDRVVHLEATAVHPEYRGNRLQERMLKHTIDYVEKQSFYYILSTVSPYNYPSLKSVISYQLSIQALSLRDGVYGGKLRYLLSRNLRDIKRRVSEASVMVKNKDIDQQIKLLEKGYIGDYVEKTEGEPGGFLIGYRMINAKGQAASSE